ncbi:hypothetical protein ACFL2O_09020 [Thermodesulfobacteriota bacterium]
MDELFGAYEIINGNPLSMLSVFSLGITPYFSAYVLVEIFSLFTPPLKKLRKGDFNGRRKLRRLALSLTLIITILQAIRVINSLKWVQLSNGQKILDMRYGYEFFLLIAILVMGVYFLIIICELISKYGIGHGVSVILLSGICSKYFKNFSLNPLIHGEIGFSAYIIALCVIFLIVYFTSSLLKTNKVFEVSHEHMGKPYNIFQFNFLPSSGAAISYTSSIVMLPATIAGLFNIGYDFADWFHPGNFFYMASTVFFIFIFSYLFAWLFFHPKRRIEKMSNRGWHFDINDQPADKYLLQKLFIYNLPWTVFLCLWAIVPNIVIPFFNVPFHIGGASIPLIVVVSFDIYDRLKFSMKDAGKNVKIAEIHDVYDAAMIKNHLENEGILSHLQGYYHRHLLYFFGPYIEMNLMVPYARKEHAKEIIKNFHGGLGLT